MPKAWTCPDCGRLNDYYPYPTRCSRCRYLHTPEAVPEVREARGYWDENLERNPLRIGRKDTDAGAFLAFKMENAGDILREYTGNRDQAYMRGKFDRIERELNVRDWADPLSVGEQARLAETKNLLENLPTPDETTTAIKDLITAITNRDVASIRTNLDKLEPLIFVEPQPPAVEVERIAKIKYFRGEEAKWRETAYKIAEEERGESPFAEAIRKADEFGRQAAELEALKPPAVEGGDLECMICHDKFDHLIYGTCESCYKKWTKRRG